MPLNHKRSNEPYPLFIIPLNAIFLQSPLSPPPPSEKRILEYLEDKIERQRSFSLSCSKIWEADQFYDCE